MSGSLQVELIDEPERLRAALAGLGAGDGDPVGIDVERADAARYHRNAALVQVGVTGRCVLLDGVRLDDLTELGAFLADRTVILHALENDLDPLAAKGVYPEHLADTAVAAAILGLPTGLRALLDEVLDLALDGDKSALQRADWAQRPLTEEMITYAASDVVYLPALWTQLEQRLATTGRTDWYAQEVTAIRQRSARNTRSWTRVKGAGRLDPRERARLRAVWEARESLARDHDIAPNRLAHDEVLRALATDPPRTEEELVRRSPRRRTLLRRYAATLLTALQNAEHVPPEPRESDGRRLTERDRSVHDALRRARTGVAEDLGLEAGVLCPSRPLLTALTSDPPSGDALCERAGLRPWQRDLLAEPLWEAYLRAREAEEPADEPADEAG